MNSVAFNPHNDHLGTAIALCAGQSIRDHGITTYYKTVYDETAYEPSETDLEVDITITNSGQGRVTITGPDEALNTMLQEHVSSVLRYPTESYTSESTSIIIDFMTPDLRDVPACKRLHYNIGAKIGEGFVNYATTVEPEVTAEDYCDICDAGPFRNVNLHKARVH